MRSTLGQPMSFGPTIHKEEEYDEQPSDRGSIRFLLNGGTDGFTERFLLPPRSDRARGLEYHTQKGLEETENSIMSYPGVKSHEQDFTPAFVDSDPAALSFYQDTFLEFFNGPFGDPNKSLDSSLDGLYAGEIPFQAVIPPPQDPRFGFPGQEPVYEPEQPFAMAMIQAIYTKACSSIPLDSKAQEEIAAGLRSLLTTARIRKFVSMYFRYWQPSCAMLHQPSFDPNTVSLPLLVAVVFMGAMYSSDTRELFVARRLVDFAELYIFSSDIYSCEHEIGSAFGGRRNTEVESSDWAMFQNFQAGFIMVVAQYWSGSRVSRNRAMENRFSEVIKVGIPHKIKMSMANGIRWRAESAFLSVDTSWENVHTSFCGSRKSVEFGRIPVCLCSCSSNSGSTMAIISLLDCAFVFYQNYPCRLSHTEMEADFPSAEAVFASDHPFQEPKFLLTREFNISDTFQNLFHEHGTQASSPTDPSASSTNMLAGLTVLDMFMIIHSESHPSVIHHTT